MTGFFIRKEQEKDYDAVRKVNREAFETDAEANLVDKLRLRPVKTISLVAEKAGEVIGHIFFSPVEIKGQLLNPQKALGLAPMAVHPAHQGSGIGSELVRQGLQTCREAGYDLCVVLGHSWFYPKFGFTPSRPYAITCVYQVPDEVFMVTELREDALDDYEGVVHYLPEFDGV